MMLGFVGSTAARTLQFCWQADSDVPAELSWQPSAPAHAYVPAAAPHVPRHVDRLVPSFGPAPGMDEEIWHVSFLAHTKPMPGEGVVRMGMLHTSVASACENDEHTDGDA